MDWIDKRNLSKKKLPGYDFYLKTGSVAAFTAALLFRRNLAAEYSLFNIFGILDRPVPFPKTVLEWFLLTQDNPIISLLYLNFFDLVNFVLVGLFFSTIIFLLYREKKTPAIIAGLLTAAGVVLSLITNPALAFLTLSSWYGTATFGEHLNLLLTGENLLEFHVNNSFQGSGIYPSFLLISFAGLILSLMMLKSDFFNRMTAVFGFLANVFGLTYYIFFALLPGLVFLPMSVSAVFLLVWYILIGRQLWRLSSWHGLPLKIESDHEKLLISPRI